MLIMCPPVFECVEKVQADADRPGRLIMLTPQGHAKVMDFGLAKRVATKEAGEQDLTTVPNEPFQVRWADRVNRLPPYLFGRINNLLYQKRRAGHDVIDMGMGNPSDPPQPIVVEKLIEAAHGLPFSNAMHTRKRCA